MNRLTDIATSGAILVGTDGGTGRSHKVDGLLQKLMDGIKTVFARPEPAAVGFLLAALMVAVKS